GEIVPSDSLKLHPGAHVLHYASTCFEGLKAFRQPDGGVKVFRMERNLARFAQSSKLLALPDSDQAASGEMILAILRRFKADEPDLPGAMYIRPTHIGTEPAIGKAGAPSLTSCQYVLLSPVGAYFTGDAPRLRLLLEEDGVRCAPHMGMIKSGGNYASALLPTLKAKQELKVDQILFCPNGDVQETGAANFILIDGDTLITKALDSSFLHGITRASILTLARAPDSSFLPGIIRDSIIMLARDLGMKVDERQLSVNDLLERAARPGCEVALSGTAAVLTAVGTLIHRGREYTVGSGAEGLTTLMLRKALNDIQSGRAEDRHGWLTEV